MARQRCSDIEHVGVFHVAHAEVQSLCQEWTVHGWCDIKYVEGYTTASNTSKCKAGEFTSALASRTGNEDCTFKSCDVPSSSVNALRTLLWLPMIVFLKKCPFRRRSSFPDYVFFVDGDWNKNSAVLEQKDLLDAVSFSVTDDVVPNDEVLNVAETETVEGEVVVDFPAMDADGKNEASLRKVVIEEVLVPVASRRARV